MIDTIIFDNEGIVIDTEHIWDKEQEIFLGRRGICYRRSETKHLLGGRSIAEGAKILKKKFNLYEDDTVLSNERFLLVKDLFNTEVKFIKGFMDFYERIRNKFKTCIATSMNEDLLSIVDQKLSLKELFNGHVYSLKHVGFKSKPNPDIFLYAAEKVKSKPETCIVFEDSPIGITAAIVAGMKCIGLATTYTKRKLKNANLIYNSFSEINPDTLHLMG